MSSPTPQLDAIEHSEALRHRLLRGIGAAALSPIVTACIQLGPVPILLHTWGAAKYGDWLLLWAIPGYLALSDMGFGDASGNDMTVRVAAGDRDGALRTFQSSWTLLLIASVVVLLVASQVAWRIPWQAWLKLSSVSNSEAAVVIFTLGVYTVLAQQNGVFESGFRCDGHYATGMSWVTALRLGEAVASTAVAMIRGSTLLTVALTYVAVRTAGTIAYGLRLRQLSPWLTLGFRHAHLKTIRDLSVPALGFIVMPLGHACSFQGFTVVIGSLLGPQSVVAFSTMRTLSRISCQLLTVVARAVWPEMSAAFGAGNIALARKLHRNACQLGLALSLLAGVILCAIGPYVYRIWVRRAVSFDTACFDVLMLGVLVNSLWLTSSVVPMSTNVHHRMAGAYLLGTSGSLALAWILIHPYGNLGAAVAILLGEVWMCWFVLPIALRQVNDTPTKFIGAMLRRPQFDRAWWSTNEL